ncbi:MAG: hypothetical protein ACLFUP_05950 [Desulfobacteraceae bacterium]
MEEKQGGGALRDVWITDVTLREYGQNVPAAGVDSFSPGVRVHIARELLDAGFQSLEILSCVHPGRAPAMSPQALKGVAQGLGRVDGADLITLVPNQAGYRRFLSLGLGPDGCGHVMGVFFSAVEAHNLANLGRGIEETLDEYEGIARDALMRGIRLRGYLSAAFGYLPPGGTEIIRPGAREISGFMDRFLDMGVETVVVSDLQGVADEEVIRSVLTGLMEQRGGRDMERLGFHPHHRIPERALSNSRVAYDIGLRRFDASLAATGGCVTGAPGNQPTEALVRAFEELGVRTGVDLTALTRVSEWFSDHVLQAGAT